MSGTRSAGALARAQSGNSAALASVLAGALSQAEVAAALESFAMTALGTRSSTLVVPGAQEGLRVVPTVTTPRLTRAREDVTHPAGFAGLTTEAFRTRAPVVVGRREAAGDPVLLSAMSARGLGVVACVPLADAGEVPGALLLTWERAGPTARRLRRFAEMAGPAARALRRISEQARLTEVAGRVAASRYESLLQATTDVAWVTDAEGRATEDSPRWRALTGQSREAYLGWGWLDAVHPDDVAAARDIWLEARHERRAFTLEYRLRYADGSYHVMAVNGVPVLDGDWIVEWVGTSVDISERRRVERQRAHDAGQVARTAERLRRLQEITAALADATRLDQVASVVLGPLSLAVGALGGQVLVTEADGTERVGALDHGVVGWRDPDPAVDEALLRASRRWETVVAPGPGESPAGDARSLLALPFRHGARFPGAVALRFRDRPPEDNGELMLLRTMVAQVELAVARAQMYEREHTLAVMLQQSLVPRGQVSTAGLETAVRYIPCPGEADIGGDWYDVLALPGGRTALVIGDVMGSGLGAATVMVRLRNALQAYAVIDSNPVWVLERLARLLERDGEAEQIVTLCYLLVEPDGREVRVVRAGHLPPLLLTPSGDVQVLEASVGPPLGVGVGWPVQVLHPPPGSRLLLYSDGLVEARDMPLVEGMERLRDAAQGQVGGPDVLCDTVLDRLAGGRIPDDDITLLAARLPEVARRELLEVPAEPASPGKARRFLGRMLASWVVGTPEQRHAAELVLDELVTNAVVHGAPPVRIEFSVTGGLLRAAVSDSRLEALPTPREAADDAIGGRGLLLVDRLTSRWGVEHHSQGKTVWCEMPVDDAAAASPPPHPDPG